MRTAFIILMGFFSLPAPAQDTLRLSLLFTGDIMQHDSQIAAAYDSGRYNYAPCFAPIAHILRQADVCVGNLEVTLAGPPYKGYPQFSAPDELAVALKEVGFDVLVTANNHSVDRGRKGIERTISILDSLAIAHTGTFISEAERNSQQPLWIDAHGFRLALLNYTYGTNSIAVPKPMVVNLIDTARIAADLQMVKTKAHDAIIIFFHWGEEYQPQPGSAQRKLAEWCFARGAKLVVGAHPHVLQPMVWKKDTDQLVAYSLGNFVSGQRARYRDGGALLQVELQKIRSSHDSLMYISQAQYHLAWAYRNMQRRYYVLPADIDTLEIKEPAARTQFRQFLADSRALLGQHNQHITEHTGFIRAFVVVASSVESLSADLLSFYGFAEQQEGWISAPIYEEEIAVQAHTELLQKGINSKIESRWLARK